MGQDISLYGQRIPNVGLVPHMQRLLPHLNKLHLSKLMPHFKWKEDGFDLERELKKWFDSSGDNNDDDEEEEVEEDRLEPYERYRTRIGAPSINRRSFTDQEIETFERENDGFPLPCTEEEIKSFDSEIFSKESSKPHKRTKKRDRQRSKSATTVPDLTTIRLKLQKLQSPGKPKFLEHLINRVVSRKVGKRDNGLILKPEDPSTSTGEPLSPETEKCLEEAELVVEELLQQQAAAPRPTSGESTDSGQGSLLESTSDFSPTQKRPPWSTPTSPTFQGIVKQRLKNFQALQEKPDSASAVSSPSGSIPASPKSSRAFQDRDCAEEIAEINRNIRKFYSDVSQDESFNASVMESGYVKALVDRINSHKFKARVVEDDEDESTLQENSSSKCSQSSLAASSKSPSKDDDSGWEEWCRETGDSEENGDVVDGVDTDGRRPCTNGRHSVRSSGSITPKGSPGSLSSSPQPRSSSPALSNSVTSSHTNSISDGESQEEENEKPKDKLHQIAHELLTTERAYVARLHLLDQVFHFRVMVENKNANLVPEEAVSQMFANIKTIYLFHKDFLLPDLEARMKTWLTEQKIGDIMAKLAPFLKLYTEYVKHYNNAMGLIDKWTKQSPKFAALLEEIQRQPECGSLTLQHHMLEPIQRVPRYEMLLKDYLKHLPSDSPDRPDAQKALELVTQAACHANKAMKKIENFIKVLNILKHLSGEGLEDIVSPTRELLKEGPITKISARSGEKQARYLFLFNDMLLLCVEQGVLGPYKYKVRARLSINGMEIVPGANMTIQNTFCVKCVEKTVEFLDESNNGHGADWLAAFEQAISDYQNKIPLTAINSNPSDMEESMEERYNRNDLGKVAPLWVKDAEVTMCMTCQEKFTKFRRRHHCRACGLIFCGRCSTRKAALEYDNNQMNRVCEKCYYILNGVEEPGSPLSPKPHGVNQVEADRAAVLSAYLNMMDKGRTWCRRWITVHDDFVMYFYKKHKDVKALHTLPLPGHCVLAIKDIPDKPNVFVLTHKDIHVCYFQADSEEQSQEWVQALKKMVLLELPECQENKRLSSHSLGSSHSSNSSGQSSQS